MAVKLGEVVTEMVLDAKKTEDVLVVLKVTRFDKNKETFFKLSQDLKKGDKVKITFEKV